jgi:hypothetical protein
MGFEPRSLAEEAIPRSRTSAFHRLLPIFGVATPSPRTLEFLILTNVRTDAILK